MKTIKIIGAAATLSLLSSVADADHISVPSNPSGPLQNYCEYQCTCTDGSSQGYIQIFVSPGTSCDGDVASQGSKQCETLCTPPAGGFLFYVPYNGVWEERGVL